MSHRTFGPKETYIAVPTSSRSAARAGLALYSPCRWTGRVARWAAWRSIDLFGTCRLVGGRATWRPPMHPELWRVLVADLTATFGTFDEIAIHERRELAGSGFAALLLDDGRSIGFAKFASEDGDDLPKEHRALTLVHANAPRMFDVPEPLSLTSRHGWHVLMTGALRPDLHRAPVGVPLAEIATAVRAGLSGITRPPGTPEHWEPMHGDFTPWNLRRRTDGSVFLVDWDQAGWGPPGADEVYFHGMARARGLIAVGRGHRDVPGSEEAHRFWIDRTDGWRRRVEGGRPVALPVNGQR